MKAKFQSMRNSLYFKLVITFFGVILITFILMAAAFSTWLQNYYENEKVNSLVGESPAFNSLYESLRDGKITPEQLSMNLSYLEKYTSSRIWMISTSRLVIGVSNSADEEVLKYREIYNQKLDQALRGYIVAEKDIFNDWFGEPMLTVMYPIVISNQCAGAVILNTPIKMIKSALNKIYDFIWLSALLAIGLSTLVIYYFSQRILIKPLYEINKTAREISSGEFEKRVAKSSKDEIGQLAESFNYMADTLQNLENMRREFIANISHELRSPITSIRGFIEGILDGTIPEDKHKYYLSVALDESKRLTRLISDVLDLSRLESGEFSLNMDTFDLNELIRVIIIRFENEIDKKKLNVDIVLTGENLYAIGDRDRIGQVISNLVDNAIKFTAEGGSISIKTMQNGKKIIVSVGDTGTGIPEQELKLIWDRFHMVDKSRTTKRGTGLGLSIARQIINQHGEKIWVESKEGVGSTFSFTLKPDQNI